MEHIDNLTAGGGRERAELLRAIPRGAENAVSMQALAARLGVSARVLRLMIAAARRDGLPVCSSACGYYLPVSRRELLKSVRRLRRMARSIFESLRPAEALLRRSTPGQEVLCFDDDDR